MVVAVEWVRLLAPRPPLVSRLHHQWSDWAPGGMDDDNHTESRRPTTNQPLNAEPRPRWSPLLAVLALVGVIALVFLTIMWLRYNT